MSAYDVRAARREDLPELAAIERAAQALFAHVGMPELADAPVLSLTEVEQYAEDVFQFCNALGLHDLVYVGHSMGGLIGIQVALSHRELLRGLVLPATPSPASLPRPPRTTPIMPFHPLARILRAGAPRSRASRACSCSSPESSA